MFTFIIEDYHVVIKRCDTSTERLCDHDASLTAHVMFFVGDQCESKCIHKENSISVCSAHWWSGYTGADCCQVTTNGGFLLITTEMFDCWWFVSIFRNTNLRVILVECFKAKQLHFFPPPSIMMKGRQLQIVKGDAATSCVVTKIVDQAVIEPLSLPYRLLRVQTFYSTRNVLAVVSTNLLWMNRSFVMLTTALFSMSCIF